MSKQKSRKQIRLALASNAGGSGKTTTAVHLAYAVAQAGYKVVIIELDYSGSLSAFTGLPHNPPFEQSSAYILQKSFKGDYPLQPLWVDQGPTLWTDQPKVWAIQGGNALEKSDREIHLDGRGFYALQDRLEDYPLDADLIILDTPASLQPMGAVALIASTHLLCPIKPVIKDVQGFAGFIEWYYERIKEFRLDPKPEILGFLPTMADWRTIGTHRDMLGVDQKGQKRTDIDLSSTLPHYVEHEFGFRCFPPIRNSNYYLKACYDGLPLHLYRPSADPVKDFEPLTQAIIELITG
jgi:chromosome partitioning protein